ncbi:MAG: hypothetical protein KGN16_02560 [Burkholderiales bacterium]|nr:hypothetical protein [Burkholderiales bacterium]
MAVVSVMGMTKNTGKTVALNHLLACAAADAVDVGLTSIGRDGEEFDAVYSIPKPPVLVWPGTVVATARDTLMRSGVRTKVLAGSGLSSPLGEILIVKVLDQGEMEVAGASRSHDQLRAIESLRRCGASQIFVDGALGRSHHASPAMADGVVLATGAAIGGGIADVLRKTRDRLAILAIPEAGPEMRSTCAELFAAQGVGLWTRDGQPLWQAPIASLNAGGELLAHDGAEVGRVAVTGAVARQLWAALLTLAERHPGLVVIVADGTRLFVDATDLAALEARGARLLAYRGIRIAGITLNPTSPLGGHFDAATFLASARDACPRHAVTDVVLESSHPASLTERSPHGATAA